MSKEPVALSTIAPEPIEGDERYYEAIHATVMESARGRWFLAEYERRNRNADTELVLSAIERIASLIQAERDQQAHRPIAGSLDLSETTSASWSAQPQPRPTALLPPYILAEQLQDIAWTMRGRGFDSAICDEIESVASRIPAAPVTHGSEEHHRQAIPADDPTTVEPGFPLDREPTDEPEASVGLERVRLGTPDIASLIRATSDSLCAPFAGLAAPAAHEETDPLLDLEQEL